MGKKIRIYESEIKRAIRRKLMERFIDEVEQMTVYDQDEFNSSFNKLEKGSYGVKDDQGKIRSVTVNEVDDDMDDEDFYPSYDSSGEFKGMSKLMGDMDMDDGDREEYYPELRIPRDMPHIKEGMSKVKPLNLSKKFKRKLK